MPSSLYSLNRFLPSQPPDRQNDQADNCQSQIQGAPQAVVRGVGRVDCRQNEGGHHTPTLPLRLRATRLLAALRSVLAAAPFTALDAQRVERPAYDMIPHAGQVADAAPTNQY